MPLYEAIFLLSPNIPLKTVGRIMKQQVQLVDTFKGVVRRLDNMGIMPLAYPMYRHRHKYFKARFMVMLFDGSNECQLEVNKALGKEEHCMRWAIYRQRDIFRDKYDELFYHHGYARGTTDIPMRKFLDKRYDNVELELRAGEMDASLLIYQAQKDIKRYLEFKRLNPGVEPDIDFWMEKKIPKEEEEQMSDEQLEEMEAEDDTGELEFALDQLLEDAELNFKQDMDSSTDKEISDLFKTPENDNK